MLGVTKTHILTVSQTNVWQKIACLWFQGLYRGLTTWTTNYANMAKSTTPSYPMIRQSLNCLTGNGIYPVSSLKLITNNKHFMQVYLCLFVVVKVGKNSNKQHTETLFSLLRVGFPLWKKKTSTNLWPKFVDIGKCRWRTKRFSKFSIMEGTSVSTIYYKL